MCIVSLSLVHFSAIQSTIHLLHPVLTINPLLSHYYPIWFFGIQKIHAWRGQICCQRIPKPCRGCLDGGRSCGEWRNKRRNLTIKNGDTSNTGGCHGLHRFHNVDFTKGTIFFPKKMIFFTMKIIERVDLMKKKLLSDKHGYFSPPQKK